MIYKVPIALNVESKSSDERLLNMQLLNTRIFPSFAKSADLCGIWSEECTIVVIRVQLLY